MLVFLSALLSLATAQIQVPVLVPGTVPGAVPTVISGFQVPTSSPAANAVGTAYGFAPNSLPTQLPILGTLATAPPQAIPNGLPQFGILPVEVDTNAATNVATPTGFAFVPSVGIGLATLPTAIPFGLNVTVPSVSVPGVSFATPATVGTPSPAITPASFPGLQNVTNVPGFVPGVAFYSPLGTPIIPPANQTPSVPAVAPTVPAPVPVTPVAPVTPPVAPFVTPVFLPVTSPLFTPATGGIGAFAQSAICGGCPAGFLSTGSGNWNGNAYQWQSTCATCGILRQLPGGARYTISTNNGACAGLAGSSLTNCCQAALQTPFCAIPVMYRPAVCYCGTAIIPCPSCVGSGSKKGLLGLLGLLGLIPLCLCCSLLSCLFWLCCIRGTKKGPETHFATYQPGTVAMPTVVETCAPEIICAPVATAAPMVATLGGLPTIAYP